MSTRDYVMVIEKINRGNPAQVFGEMLTLLESDKRRESEALGLSYRKSEGERVYIPDNVYVIGTMNRRPLAGAGGPGLQTAVRL